MSTYRIAPPFRAEHIGSLKRPADLLAKRKQFDAGKCTQAELDEVADRAIRDVVALQQAVGIKGVTDGEFRRHMLYVDSIDRRVQRLADPRLREQLGWLLRESRGNDSRAKPRTRAIQE